MKYTIYTDGSCEPNPGPGGYGAVVEDEAGERREVSGREQDTTNNCMELRAAIEGVRVCEVGSTVLVVTDSRYVELGATVWWKSWVAKGWVVKGRKIANRDLWEALLAEHAEREVQYKWVKGHEGHPGNEQAHQLAEEARLFTHSGVPA